MRPFFGFSSPVGTLGGSTLRNVGDSSYFYVSDDINIQAQISWYADLAETSEQYLMAVDRGAQSSTDPTALWYSTQSVGSINVIDMATLAEFDAQFAIDPTLAGASVQGVGLYNHGAPLINFYSYLAGGNLFYFTPQPVFTAPTSIGQVDFGTAGRGVTVTTTGFVPGETVSAFENTTQSTSDAVDLIADANGSVTYTWVAPVSNMDLGTYSIAFVGLSSGVQQFFEFDVTAQAALAVTGIGTGSAVVAVGALLIGGLLLAVAATRTRRLA